MDYKRVTAAVDGLLELCRKHKVTKIHVVAEGDTIDLKADLEPEPLGPVIEDAGTPRDPFE